ncbi:MAG: helix-turn-helix domain-containing protein [Synechococcus sp. SB0665_bin_28]|nr:helix-turn-helix domain-containing protein [Synechococcus sp. SB0665_bin_28]MYF19468.1 helix-turn-helix domain-containing protein [Synechococcus sp. SB0677_bin_5]
MNMLRAFRSRFYPTPEQENLLRRTLAVCFLSTTRLWMLAAGHGLRKGKQSPATRPIRCSRAGNRRNTSGS